MSSHFLAFVSRRDHPLNRCVESHLNRPPYTDVGHCSRRNRIHPLDDRLFRDVLQTAPVDIECMLIDRYADDPIRSWIISAAANSDIDVAVVDGATMAFDADQSAIGCQMIERPPGLSTIYPFLHDPSMPLRILSIPSSGRCMKHPRCSRFHIFWERLPQSFRTAIRMLRDRKTSACTFLKRLFTRSSSKI